MAIHGHYHFLLQGTKASRPATPTNDLVYIATDTNEWSFYDTVGAAWSAWFSTFSGLPLAIASGGTGQTTKAAAFDALSPAGTKGDLIVYTGATNGAHAAGADYTAPVFDTAATDGIRNSYRNRSLTLFAAGLTKTYTTSASYTAIFSTGTSNPTHTKIDITGYRQARLLSFGGIQAGGGSPSASIKAVDTTNAVDITSLITFNNTTLSQKDSGWTNLNANSYAAEIELEVQAIEGSGGDVLRIDNLILEFR